MTTHAYVMDGDETLPLCGDVDAKAFVSDEWAECPKCKKALKTIYERTL
jgi:hypothetical protein